MSEEIIANNLNETKYEVDDLVFNQYKVIKQIAKGGMNSYIYLAEDTHIQEENHPDRFVAIKVINRSQEMSQVDWDRFHDECITAIRVSECPNVIKTFRIKENIEKTSLTIVMEYVNGKSLRQVLNQQGALSVNESLFLFRKILLALKSLYSFKQKVIHRDLKPENILLSKDRTELKIIDFGIASIIAQSHKNSLISNESQLFGTYPYLSPDLLKVFNAKDESDKLNIINEQCDFFSIGVILYEMLVGSKPFIAADYSKEEVIGLPLKYDLPDMNRSNPKIPVGLENIVFRCIASKKEDIKFRYNSIDEIIADLDELEIDVNKQQNQHLLKSYHKRVMQNSIFNMDKEKTKTKFYVSAWFFWTLTWLTILLGVTAIILILVFHLI